MNRATPETTPSVNPPAAPTRAAEPRVYWRGFDLLRGLAAVLMVVNHTGYMLTSRDHAGLVHYETGSALTDATALQWAVLLGGFAPVVFFFVTGLGYGVQAGGPKRKSRFGLTRKVLILFAADALMWRQAGYAWGLDFFGFIAVSMLVLAGLLACDGRRSENEAPPSVHGYRTAALLSLPRSAWLSLAALAAVLGLRFVLGPVAERFFGVGPESWLHVVTGRNLNPDVRTGVSFPPIPWLAYPLAGFVLGAWLQRHRAVYLAHRVGFVLACLFAGVVCAALVGLMLRRGYPLYRWGTMSVASVVAGFAVMAALVALASAVEDWGGLAKRVVDALSLRGVAAFAVVPLHFGMIGVAQAFDYQADSLTQVWLTLTVVTVFAMVLAPWAVPIGDWLRRRKTLVGWWAAGVVLAATAFVLVDREVTRSLLDLAAAWAGVDPEAWSSSAASRIAGAAGQLVLCWMLVLPAVKRQPQREPKTEPNHPPTDSPDAPRVREPGPPTSPAAPSM